MSNNSNPRGSADREGFVFSGVRVMHDSTRLPMIIDDGRAGVLTFEQVR